MTTVFTYPEYGTPCGYPELKERSGQAVTIMGELTDTDTEYERIYRVRFADGLEHEAFESELTPSPTAGQTTHR